METAYTSYSELTELQHKIMIVVSEWAHKEKTPIALKEIMLRMKEQGVKGPTIINSIHGLLKKGYIRRAYVISNKTYFVQLRSI